MKLAKNDIRRMQAQLFFHWWNNDNKKVNLFSLFFHYVESLNDSFRFLNDHLVDKVENFLTINNAIYLNKTDGKDSKNGKGSPLQGFPGTNSSWFRTSLLLKYLTESQSSQLFAYINEKYVTEVDFHVNASFDYMNETGFWDDGERIDAEWWFRKSENDNETIIPLFDQVKTISL